MKYVSYLYTTLLVVLSTLLMQCRADWTDPGTGPRNTTLREGDRFEVNLDLTAGGMPVTALTTRAADNELAEIQSLRLLVFDEDQKFLYSSDAVLGGNHKTSGQTDPDFLPDGERVGINDLRQFKVQLMRTDKPVYIHFVTDYPWANFAQDYFIRGVSAGELIPRLTLNLTDEAPFKPKWSYIYLPKGIDAQTFKGKVIKLLRNYALVTVDARVPATDGFTYRKAAICFKMNQGALAQYRTQGHAVDFRYRQALPTIPTDAGRDYPSVDGVDESEFTTDPIRLFESANQGFIKTCLLITGDKLINGRRQKRYYKIDFVQVDPATLISRYLPILRNHQYKVVIKGVRTDGFPTATQALEAPAGNNVLASFELEDFSKISNGSVQMTVTPIRKVVVKAGEQTFKVTYTGGVDNVKYYANWVGDHDPYLGDLTAQQLDAQTLELKVNVDNLPSDNIKEYTIDVLGRDGDKAVPRKIILTLRPPFDFNERLEPDPNSPNVYDKLLTFQVYNEIPPQLIPFEVQLSMLGHTPRNGSGVGNLPLFRRNGKLYYSFTVTPAIYEDAMKNHNGRVSIPVKENALTKEQQRDIYLTSELYRDARLFSGVRKNQTPMRIYYTTPDGRERPYLVTADPHFEVNGIPYTGGAIELVATGEGVYELRIGDKALADTDQLTMKCAAVFNNPSGFLRYNLANTQTVTDWLKSENVNMYVSSIDIQGFISHQYQQWFRTNYGDKPQNGAPYVQLFYYDSGRGMYETVPNGYYQVDNQYDPADGRKPYRYHLTLPLTEVNHVIGSEGIYFRYENYNGWYYYRWNELEGDTFVAWPY